jgi:hypothetical protein
MASTWLCCSNRNAADGGRRYLFLQLLIGDRSDLQSSFQTWAYHVAPCVGDTR